MAVVLVLALSACGGSSPRPVTTQSGSAPPLSKAVARTVAAGTARFSQRTAIGAGGSIVHADANGAASLRVRLGHIYKLNPGGGIPREIVVIGPVTYTNANVEAALADPSVPPWTKLDTRRLNARERAAQADDLAHAVAPAFLAGGVAKPTLVASSGGRAVYRGSVDPALLERNLPAASRSWIMSGVRADYPASPFDARFWLDASGRVRRVLVTYKTPAGTPVAVDTRYSGFGTPVGVSLPRASEIKDVTPAR
jgi:hypothetical protein